MSQRQNPFPPDSTSFRSTVHRIRRASARGVVLTAVAVTLAAPALLLAGPGHGHRPGAGPGPGFGPGGRGHLHGMAGALDPGEVGIGGVLRGRVAERLELTAEQKERIRGILEAERESIEPQMERMHTARRALMEAIHAAEPSEGAIRSAAEELGNAQTEMAVLRGRVAGQVHAVLTTEQKARLEEAKAEMREWGDRFQERRRDRRDRFFD